MSLSTRITMILYGTAIGATLTTISTIAGFKS